MAVVANTLGSSETIGTRTPLHILPLVSTVTTYSEGTKINPTSSTLMADTGELAAGTYEFRTLVGANAAATMDVQHRNAANDANIIYHTIFTGPNSGMFVFTATLVVSQRLRIIMRDSVSGTACASIQARLI